MTHAQDGAQDGNDEQDGELERTRELLARTVRFLERCAEDPHSAMASEDPRELIRGLESLDVGPDGPEPGPRPVEEETPRTIPIHRRRSA